MALDDHHWAFQPVNPLEFFARLRSCLEPVGTSDVPTAEDVTSLPFPDYGPHFREQYLLKEVLRKYPSFDLGIDTRSVAVSTFLEDEAINRETNDRLLGLPNSSVAPVLQLARRKISEILGDFDSREFWRSWRFGPHSTLSLNRHDASVENKMSLERPKVPARAYGIAQHLLSETPGLAYAAGGLNEGKMKCIDLANTLSVCEWDRFESVPKNAKTDRGIGIPPDFSVMMQLAVGRMMRRRLHAYGVNLNDQSINQRAAYFGSLDASRATVDVKSASQSITCGVVYSLIGSQDHREMDPRWYLIMDALRSPLTLIEGELHENELFSAMGNGYTFELESLIFYSLAHACCTHLGVSADLVSTYGDDIVLPGNPDVCDLLIEVFDWVGFRLNLDKSFGLKESEATPDGWHFRESCGKHFLNGRDVTPFYVDSPLDSPTQIMLLHNNLIRWSSIDGFRDGRVLELATWVISHLGQGYRSCLIPLGEENDGLIADWDEAVHSVRTTLSSHALPSGRVVGKGRLGFSVKTVTERARPRELPDYARYLRWMYNSRECASGWKPPSEDHLSNIRPFRSNWRLAVHEAIEVAPEIPKSKGLKVNLRPSRRLVYQWGWLGPWVLDESLYSGNYFDVASKMWLNRDKTLDKTAALESNQRRRRK